MSKKTADILIVGAGMVGAATACMLARAGMSVQLLETVAPRPWSADEPVGLRVSALSPGSQNVLDAAGVWQQIAAQRHCPYRRMRVEDGDERVVLDFNAAEFALDRLGSIVENELVQHRLWQQMQNLASIELLCPASVKHIELQLEGASIELSDGRRLAAPLLVGADGAASVVRRAMGVEQQVWTYSQQGIVCVVKSAIENTGLAWQRFMPGGPLAFLPLADGTNSIVWSRPDAEAGELLALDDQEFLQRLQSAVAGLHEPGGLFGELQSCGPRASFPLTMALSDTYAAQSSVLLGDAAHVVHPLAGQGVNLGLLDAAALVETLLNNRKQGKPLNDEHTLQAWSRWRRSESELMARGIHGIRSLFAIQPLAPLRRLGLGLLSRNWLGKEAFIRRAAGLNRNAPALARGQELGQLMR
ncbi:MAG TPA: UbiH/UbiF/VisC/COQ6 family ubiquinone biosynthesis hydroxylase [Xanthomonadales bacterium]|nr:UbiH/UbiF/VisC/COQ6 family ubiquinone biosynthesis hydroxylase [Xanthomonadales bacterium]